MQKKWYAEDGQVDNSNFEQGKIPEGQHSILCNLCHDFETVHSQECCDVRLQDIAGQVISSQYLTFTSGVAASPAVCSLPSHSLV